MFIIRRLIFILNLILEVGNELWKESIWNLKAKKNRRKSQLISLMNNIVLVDVGASYFFPESWKLPLASLNNRVISIDPNENNLNYVKYVKEMKVKIVTKAVGQKKEKRKFYKTNIDSGSSLYAPELKESHKLKMERDLEFYFFPFEIQNIETISLSDAIGEIKKNETIWIKLDTQGSELEILTGATNILKSNKVVAIELEASLLSEPIMKGSCRFHQIIDFMDAHNFELTLFKPIYSQSHQSMIRTRIKRGYLNECDVLFTPKLSNFSAWDLDRKISLFAVYVSYGLVELAFRVVSRDAELSDFLTQKRLENHGDLINQIESLVS